MIDIDAHHGNGTQELFYARDDVFFGSVHVDPGARLVPALPRLRGRARRRRRHRARTATSRSPPGTGDVEWVAAVHDLVEEARRFNPAALVVSLGVDAAEADPESPLQGHRDRLRARRPRARRRSTSRPSSCRKAATTSSISARSSSRCSPASRTPRSPTAPTADEEHA